MDKEQETQPNTEKQKQITFDVLKFLQDTNQDHILPLFEKASPSEKETFNKQLIQINKNYPGGLYEYINRAKHLLENSKKGYNPYEGLILSVPEGSYIKVGDSKFFQLESIGMEELKDACFVLVAGGRGERLGYSDIKISIQTELITKKTFFQVYADFLLGYQSRLRGKYNLGIKWFIPLCIMTSDATNYKTISLLQKNKYFGLQKEQIEIVKQEKFPSLIDNQCHLDLMKDSFLIDTKPHGHGDVHTLLLKKGVVERWRNNGKKWIIFFQDTNILVFNMIPSAIGLSKDLGLSMNFLCIPRKPNEPIGSICQLKNKEGKSITLNVEYNLIETVLQKSNKEGIGDTADENGNSRFPGNTNVLIFSLDPYYKALINTQGIIPEFVNPKYADETKTKFKTSTRLECMMQDFPKLFNNNEKVGYCMYEKWFGFSTLKNNLKDGCEKMKKNLIPETAFSVERDIFAFNTRCLKDILGKLTIEKTEEDTEVEIEGQKVKFGPKIVIYPSFAHNITELKKKITHNITLTNNSTLILKNDIEINGDIYVDGVLEIMNDVNADVKCVNKKRNKYIKLKPGEGETYEKIRGYTMVME